MPIPSKHDNVKATCAIVNPVLTTDEVVKVVDCQYLVNLPIFNNYDEVYRSPGRPPLPAL